MQWKSCKLKCKIIDFFHLTILHFISVSSKKQMRKKSKEEEQTWEELNSALRHSQSKSDLILTSYIKWIKLFLFNFGLIINILLPKLRRSLWQNLNLARVYRPHCVWSVLASSVKILPYRHPARLIRTKQYCCAHLPNVLHFYLPIISSAKYTTAGMVNISFWEMVTPTSGQIVTLPMTCDLWRISLKIIWHNQSVFIWFQTVKSLFCFVHYLMPLCK